MAQEGYSDAASYVIRSFTRPGFTLTYPPSFLPSRTSRFGVKRICPRDLAFRAIDELEAGITYINAPTIGAEIQLPFGGIKNTGNGGREAGTTAIEEFTEIKTVFIDYSDKLQKAQIDR